MCLLPKLRIRVRYALTKTTIGAHIHVSTGLNVSLSIKYYQTKIWIFSFIITPLQYHDRYRSCKHLLYLDEHAPRNNKWGGGGSFT